MRKTIENHLETYRKSYLLLSIFFIIGVIIGVYGLNHSNLNAKNQIISYINNAVLGIEKGKISYLILLKNLIGNRIQFILFLVFLCLSIIGKYGAISLVIFKGFTVGYAISSSIITYGIGRGILLSLILTLTTEIILIPTIFYTAITCLQMFNDSCYQNYENKRNFIFSFISKIICVILVIILISMIETFINVNIFLLVRKLYN